ncbi:HD domain-containing protein [Spartinivicinus poritis]|uniref:Metal-dependent HD superfamily phosphohydrolase n=1 Tax=Spartinivicinus poritis TaxID=2994640 RepID=A0ABT5UAN1_9GAMM|nr:hypothetical protein [Spartinivicinus sp. A2-2]MDE1463445.1 hypothetical protein [Spartinivicinus sp. A2-2]
MLRRYLDPMMQRRFCQLWNRTVAGSNDHDAGEVFHRIYSYYNSDERYYHSTDHIKFCLEQLDLVSELLTAPDAVEMAIWFHDVIYERGACDNEIQSAQFFKDYAAEKLNPEFADLVYSLILDTTHKHTPTTLDGQYLADIDLSSMALPWQEFLRDSTNVRAECSHLCDNEFYPKQLAFLESLLERKQFFFTDFFQQRFGDQAQDNLQRLIKQLNQQGFHSCNK